MEQEAVSDDVRSVSLEKSFNDSTMLREDSVMSEESFSKREGEGEGGEEGSSRTTDTLEISFFEDLKVSIVDQPKESISSM